MKNNNKILPHNQINENNLNSNSFISYLFLFLIEPTFNLISKLYNIFLSILVILHVILMILQSIDGPNYYNNRKNMSTYPYLFNQSVSFIFLFILFV